MKVILFGATGMVGQGVLRECLLDKDVEVVKTLGRKASATQHPKLYEVVHPNLWDYSDIEGELKDLDACFFCLGVSSLGMSEPDYAHVTYELTVAAGQVLSRLNPGMTMVFVSGQGTDSTEKGPVMWARVKGKAENALAEMPFKAVYFFRPGMIQPLHGIQSRTPAYRIIYALMRPFLPLLKRLFPGQITTTENVGKAMLQVAKKGFPQRILGNREMNAAAASYL